MAQRPAFRVCRDDHPPWIKRHTVEFEWHAGMAMSQLRKNVRSLHENFLRLCPGCRILEVSSAAEDTLGQSLSAFALKTTTLHGAGPISVESAYQGSKVFRQSGQLQEAYALSPRDAKRLARARHDMDELTAFHFDGTDWPLEPLSLFYNWLYIRALQEHPEIARQLMSYDAFSDIRFNPSTSVSSQAEAAAYFVSFSSHGILDQAISDRTFLAGAMRGKQPHRQLPSQPGLGLFPDL